MERLILLNAACNKKIWEATRSRHSSFAFIPLLKEHLANLGVLKRIVKDRDKGKRF